MHRSTGSPLLLALALACAPGQQTSATTKTTHASDATDSDSTTGTSAPPTSGTSTAAATTTDTLGSTGTSTSPPVPDLGRQTCDTYDEPNACPEGQKCVPYANDGGNAWNALHCVPLDPNPGAPGDPCTSQGIASSIDTCDVGSMCWNISLDTGLGTCISFCTGSAQSPTCADPDHLCVTASDAVLSLCLQKCDPLTNTPCSMAMELCLPNPQGQAGFLCILDASQGMGPVNASCAFANACNPGLICVNVALGKDCDQNAPGCCQPYCDLSMGMQPDPNPVCDTMGGQFCLPLFDMGMAPPGAENVGVCGIPQ